MASMFAVGVLEGHYISFVSGLCYALFEYGFNIVIFLYGSCYVAWRPEGDERPARARRAAMFIA